MTRHREEKYVFWNDVRVERETEKALLCAFARDGAVLTFWFPKSQVAPHSAVRGAYDEGKLVVTQWIYDQKAEEAKGLPDPDGEEEGETVVSRPASPGFGAVDDDDDLPF